MGDVLEELIKRREEKVREEEKEKAKKEREKGRKEGEKRGMEKGMEKERIQTLGVLLAFNSPDTLLHDPNYAPFGYTLAEINAAMAAK